MGILTNTKTSPPACYLTSDYKKISFIQLYIFSH